MNETIIYFLIGFLALSIGFIIGKLLAKGSLESTKTSLENSNQLLEESKISLNELQIERLKLTSDNTRQDADLKNLQQNIDILTTKLSALIGIKNEKEKTEFILKTIEGERNLLKTENTTLKNTEESRIKQYQKNIEASNTLQASLEKEKVRLNDERINNERIKLEKLKETWSNHEKDVENHIRLLCKNNVITYIEQNDFPYAGKKPDNIIEILEQYIIFDAKSPANEDLSNFPKYIKVQTENLKKYAKHESVKNDLFLVIPSNTLSVIKEFTYNIGDYNVFIVSKDSLEPIILSLKKIEEYEFADKLSPEERDNVCRIIGKFAHTTKRKIQIDQFFANEFLEILHKSKTLLPREILQSVIEFENAEKLNPPMEKRKKQILTQDLIDKTNELKKEIELRDIPQIETKITFKKDKGE